MTMVRPNPPATERRVLFKIRGIPVHPPRGPKRYFTDATDGYAIYPLVVLFGLNAVDELDRSVFGVLGPEIRDSFGLSNQGYLSLVALTLIGGLLLELPLAYYADRLPRARLAVIGAAVWSVFGFATGLTTTILMLVIVRSGAGMGRAVVTPTHLSLLSDYYPLESRTKVYGVHRIANAVGLIVGPLVGGILAEQFGWRVPFFVFVIPSLVFVVLGLRLKEPGRGHFERAAGGAEQAVIETDEEPPSWAESVRILWQVRTLRRIWFSLPFLAASVIGLASLTSIYYEEVFHLSESQRGFVAASAEPFGVIGIMVGISLASRLILKDPGMGLRLLSFVAIGIAGAWIAFALAPALWVAIVANILISGLAALLAPGIFASLSLAIPPKVRSLGFSMASLFILPGLIVLYMVGGIADRYGIRQGMLIMVPVFLIGAMILSSASLFVKSDINKVWTSTAAQAEVRYQRSKGEVKLLLVRNVDVSYDNVQVLFGVNLEVDEGEIVALLGTNGAGKSTLLKAIAGVVPADAGAIVFDGRDATYAPPHEIAARGIVMVPGGQGVFPSLTVAENLRLAGWLDRDRRSRADAIERALEMFPVLAEPDARARREPQRRSAADAHARDGAAVAAAPDHDRRAVARSRAEHRRRAAQGGAAPEGAGHDRHPRRAVGERRAHRRRDRVLHGEGRDPLPRPDERTARAQGRAAFGVPRGRGIGRARRRQTRDRARGGRRRRFGRPDDERRQRCQRSRRTDQRAAAPGRRRVEDVRRHQRAHRRVIRRARRRGARVPRSERRGQDDAVRRAVGLSVERPGRRPPRRRLHRQARPGRASAARARAFLPGRPAVPRTHRDRDDRRRPRAQHRRARSDRGRAAPPVGRRLRSEGAQHASTS